ncbi:MAG: tetratricopeptide repeat protein [Planctomycetaceae bacterium]|nr:MAG: tetratricopeptide repeat protein [Planctomycetaceae bacterium]
MLEARRPQRPVSQQKFKTPRSVRPSADLHRRKLLGRGGLGCVYRYRDDRLGRDLALKVCQHHVFSSTTGVERFNRERRITAKLCHPSIPPVHHCGEFKDGRPYYVMRLIRGRSLQKLLQQRKSLPMDYRHDAGLSRLLDAFEKICDAVQFAHSANVIHRDIKPANIVIEKNGAAFLLDWGLARESASADIGSSSERDAEGKEPSELTQGNNRIGSPDYMSPEQAEGHSDQHGPATDVYGLGATLFHILTGVAANAATRSRQPESRRQMYARIASSSPPSANVLAPHVPPPLVSICRKALQINPADRYASARALCDDLVRWRRNEVVLAHADRYNLVHKAQLFSLRHRSLVTAVALGVFILMTVSIAAAAIVSDKNVRLDSTNRSLENFNRTLEQKNLALDETNAQLVATNRTLDDKIADLNEATLKLLDEKERLELSLQIGFKMLRGIETGQYQSLNDVYVDALQNGLRLPDVERAAMLPLYKALIAMQKADALMSQGTQDDFSLSNLYHSLINKANAKTEVMRAMDLLDQSIGQSDQIGLAWLLRAQLRMEYLAHAKDDVLADWDRAVLLLPDCSASFSGRGFCLLGLGRTEEAMKDLTKAIELDPRNEYAHRGLGEIYYGAKDYDTALEKYFAALELPMRYNTDPRWNEVLYQDLAYAYWLRGVALVRGDSHEQAINDFIAALKYCHPKQRPELWTNVALVMTTCDPEGVPEGFPHNLITVWGDERDRQAFARMREFIVLLSEMCFGTPSPQDLSRVIESMEAGKTEGSLEITSAFVDCVAGVVESSDLMPEVMAGALRLVDLLNESLETRTGD